MRRFKVYIVANYATIILK